MASVFLSYDRDDADRARHFAVALEKAGHEVWWDLHVRSGAQFSKVIDEALQAADVVVVLWSVRSIESAWVRDEAAAGRDTGRLVPVTIDGTEPPLGFRQFQTIDLSKWKGRGRPEGIRTLLADVASLEKGAGSGTSAEKPISKPIAQDWKVGPFAVAAVAVVAMLAAVLVWRPWSSATAPTVLVASGRNDSASEALTRDFATQLGSLPALQSGSLRLVTSTADKPSLVLEVTRAADPRTAGANLLLKSTADHTVIWSDDFEQGQRSAADMKLQMAFTAARVLGCATDALSGNALPKQSRTLYLTSCGQTVEGRNYDPETVIAGLTKVVTQAPSFTPAWRKLLQAEADAIGDEPPSAAQAGILRKHIAAARRLDAHMPEATIAEIALVPLTNLGTRMRLIDRALEQDPDNPIVLMRRAELLGSVGRMGEAVGMTLNAMHIDPMSPAVLSSYISALAYNGQTDVAEQQLKRAERLWPGTSALADIEFRYYLRIGDPRIGLQLASDQSSLTPTMLMYLQARANPTKANVDKLLSFYSNHLSDDPSLLPALGMLAQAFSEFHRENELYTIALRWPIQDELNGATEIWFRPAFHEFRRDPRFMQLAARTPLLKYWRTTGKWPDFCSEPDLPYNCKTEAAKYV